MMIINISISKFERECHFWTERERVDRVEREWREGVERQSREVMGEREQREQRENGKVNFKLCLKATKANDSYSQNAYTNKNLSFT